MRVRRSRDVGRLRLGPDGLGMWADRACTRAVGCISRFRFGGDFVSVGVALRVMHLRRRSLVDHIRRKLTLGVTAVYRVARDLVCKILVTAHCRYRRGASVAREVVDFCDCWRDGLFVYIRVVEFLHVSLAHRRMGRMVRIGSAVILHHRRWADAAHTVGRVIGKVQVLRRGRLAAKDSRIL